MRSIAHTAPYPLRLRLAVSGLTIAWFFAALFLFLGLRAQDRLAQAGAGEATAASAVSSPLR